MNHSTHDEKNEMLIERVLPGINSKISEQTKGIDSLEKVTNSLENNIMNSDDDSNNNFNNIENSIQAFYEHIGKFPGIINNEKNNLTNTDTLQNNENDIVVKQENIIIQPINIICNEQHLLIPHKFANVTQILLFWNTNKLKMGNKKYRKQYSTKEIQRIIELNKL